MDKHDNIADRGAGSGVIRRGATPMRRGIWDLYETTNPLIGRFDRCFWIELTDSKEYIENKERKKALIDLAKFFEQNITDNIIVLEYANRRVMGGVSINAGTSYLRDLARKKAGVKDKWPDPILPQGYELRFCNHDASTFLMLWAGYELDGKT